MVTSTKRSGKFFVFMIPAFFLWLIGQYFFPIFTADQLNVAIPYLIENFGWTINQITDPNSVGRIFSIPSTLLWGTLIIKLGPKPMFCGSMFLYGFFEVFIAFHSSYTMFYVGMVALPIIGTAILMSTFSLVRNWFRSWRGTALGIVTMVSPLGNATIIQYLSHGVGSWGFTFTFMTMAVLVAAAGLVGMVIIRETPEQVGCFPDGALVAPPPEPLVNDTYVKKIGLRHLARHKEFWLHMLTFGIVTSALSTYPAFFVARFTELGFAPGQVTAFTYGFSLIGAALSLLSGIIDDKLGTRSATLLITILFFFGTIGLRFGTPENPWMIWVGIAALGGIVGAAPNLSPSMVVHIFGRLSFDHVFRYVNTGVYIFPACAIYFVSHTMEASGSFNLPYGIMIPVSFIAVVTAFLLKKKVDLTADVDNEIKKKEERKLNQ